MTTANRPTVQLIDPTGFDPGRNRDGDGSAAN